MQRRLLCGMAVLVIGGIAIASLLAADSEAKKPNLGKLQHIVLFGFKDSATAEQIKEVEDAFRALPSKIPTIVDFEWGTNNSPENLAKGYTHCFHVTFNDDAGRAVYLPHPAHKAFGKVLHPIMDKVLVIDYVAKE
jgi:hypothetical protein